MSTMLKHFCIVCHHEGDVSGEVLQLFAHEENPNQVIVEVMLLVTRSFLGAAQGSFTATFYLLLGTIPFSLFDSL